jgi:GDPmannose 4,6-dehydratase
MTRALITGITGQDGHHLTHLLLSKGYEIHGIVTETQNEKSKAFAKNFPQVTLHNGDLGQQESLTTVIGQIEPREIYHLGALSFVDKSFSQPELTADITGLGTLRLLEAIRKVGGESDIRIYNASSSEMFGVGIDKKQNEQSPFHPRSPYGAAKTFGFHTCVNYREAYEMHISSGILFNHEGEYRGHEYVTRKITSNVARIALGYQKRFALGDLTSSRDWGYAGDYVEAMWLMNQQSYGDDYVVASGEVHTVADFLRTSLRVAELPGDIENYVDFDKKFTRPTEVLHLVGDASKAREKLGWKPTVNFENLVEIMVANDLRVEEKKHG